MSPSSGGPNIYIYIYIYIYIGNICLRTPATTPNGSVRKQSLHITTEAN
jgi:hypothetical protein